MERGAGEIVLEAICEKLNKLKISKMVYISMLYASRYRNEQLGLPSTIFPAVLDSGIRLSKDMV